MFKEVSEVSIFSMTEEEFANWRQKEGASIIFHQGRHWEKFRPGFYQPIHLIASLTAKQATRPTLFCWGFRAALSKSDEGFANGAIPVHLLSDIQNYDLESLSSNRRNHVRRSRKRAEIVELIDPLLLQEQGYEVLVSALTRGSYKAVPSKDEYIASISNYIIPKRRLILAGLIEGKLGGYIEAHAVEGTAYIQSVYVATEALSTYIGTGLVFDFVQVCRRSGKINQIVYGQHSREDEALCVFKDGMRFPVKHIPAKVQINPVMDNFIRWRTPDSYYRLTGRD